MFNFKRKSERKYKGRVLVVDRVEPWGNPLIEMLEEMNYRVETASSYDEAKRILSNATFDVTVIEPRLKMDEPSNLDGMRLIALISNTQRSKNIIIYTAFATPRLVKEVFKYKVLDFIDKTEHPEHAFAAIESAVAMPSAVGRFPHLTIAEQEVLELIMQGKRDVEIAQEINSSKDTVKEHVDNIMAKLNARDRAEVIERAERNYLVVRDSESQAQPAGSLPHTTLFPASDSTTIEKSASVEHPTASNNERLSNGVSKNPQAVERQAGFRSSGGKSSKTNGSKPKGITEMVSARKRPLSVFLCHAHVDASEVRNLYLRLVKDGVDAWLDKEKLLPGVDWEHEIRKAVRDADVVVVCHSKDFNQKGFRQKEVRLALDAAMEQPDGEIFIIPACVEECEILESLNKWHRVDLYKRGGYKMLIEALKIRAEKVGASL